MSYLRFVLKWMKIVWKEIFHSPGPTSKLFWTSDIPDEKLWLPALRIIPKPQVSADTGLPSMKIGT